MDMKTTRIKMLQDVRTVNYLPNRSALPKSDGLYLMRLRSSLLPQELPKGRMIIPVMVRNDNENHAQHVKITRL